MKDYGAITEAIKHFQRVAGIVETGIPRVINRMWWNTKNNHKKHVSLIISGEDHNKLKRYFIVQ